MEYNIYIFVHFQGFVRDSKKYESEMKIPKQAMQENDVKKFSTH